MAITGLMLPDIALYAGLFWNALIAATILPVLSEFTLAALLASGKGAPLLLLLSATLGNISGSLINWWLGHRLVTLRTRKWFPFNVRQLETATKHFNRFGMWSLLFAWVPVVGDPLTLVAGVLRTPLIPFLILVTIGKTLRYSVIVVSFTYI